MKANASGAGKVVGTDGADAVMGMVGRYGTHVVAAATVGDVIFQVFSFSPSFFRRLLSIHQDPLQHPLSGIGLLSMHGVILTLLKDRRQNIFRCTPRKHMVERVGRGRLASFTLPVKILPFLFKLNLDFGT